MAWPGQNFSASNAAEKTITTFFDGVDGQHITVQLDLNTGIAHNASINLSTCAAISPSEASTDTLLGFVNRSGVWYETWRRGASSGVIAGVSSSEAFVTIGNSSTLANERALTAGSHIEITDNGANSCVVINAASTLARASVCVVAGSGLTGGGDLTANRSGGGGCDHAWAAAGVSWG